MPKTHIFAKFYIYNRRQRTGVLVSKFMNGSRVQLDKSDSSRSPDIYLLAQSFANQLLCVGYQFLKEFDYLSVLENVIISSDLKVFTSVYDISIEGKYRWCHKTNCL